MVGTAAITANRLTICTCNREPARPRRRGRAGSRLHVQIVSLFAVIAAVPTILVAVVASTTLHRGLDRFFSTHTRVLIEQSLIVAQAYINEHVQAIRAQDVAVA